MSRLSTKQRRARRRRRLRYHHRAVVRFLTNQDRLWAVLRYLCAPAVLAELRGRR